MTRAMKRLYGNPQRFEQVQPDAARDNDRPKRRVRRGPGVNLILVRRQAAHDRA